MTDNEVLEDINRMSVDQWHKLEFPAGTDSNDIEGFAQRIMVKSGKFKLAVIAQITGNQVSFQLRRRL